MMLPCDLDDHMASPVLQHLGFMHHFVTDILDMHTVCHNWPQHPFYGVVFDMAMCHMANVVFTLWPRAR